MSLASFIWISIEVRYCETKGGIFKHAVYKSVLDDLVKKKLDTTGATHQDSDNSCPCPTYMPVCLRYFLMLFNIRVLLLNLRHIMTSKCCWLVGKIIVLHIGHFPYYFTHFFLDPVKSFFAKVNSMI